MGKSKGKMFFTIAMAFVGFANPAMFGLKAGMGFLGGVYGASLGGSLWTATHQKKETSASAAFDSLANTVTSRDRIPIIYGTRKWGGFLTWHEVYDSKKQIHKDIVWCEGEVSGISDVRANDIPMSSISNASYTFQPGSINPEQPDNYLKVGGYRRCAWSRFHFTANDLVSGNPTVTAVVKGKLITDTRTSAYAYSENPAMCIRDYLISKRYGAGHFISTSDIDEDSFKEIADYCDALVTTRVPTTLSTVDAVNNKISELNQYLAVNTNISSSETDKINDEITRLQLSLVTIASQPVEYTLEVTPRYTMNIIIAEQKSHLEILQDMLAVFGGYLVFCNNKVSLRCERALDVSYDFNDDNIIQDTLVHTQYPIESSPNRYNVTFYDPNNYYTGVKLVVEDLVSQKERGKIISKDVDLTGCTSQSQALRLARMYRDKVALSQVVVTFSTATMAMHLEPGDIITITKNIYPNGVSALLFDHVPFRILEISEESGIYTIKAEQYNASIYNDAIGAQIQVQNYVTVDNPAAAPPAVTNLAASEYGWLSAGYFVSNIDLSYTASVYSYAVTYMITLSDDNGSTWRTISATSDTSYRIENISKGNYVVGVQPMNKFGVLGDTTTVNLTVTGKDYPPDNVSNLVATVDAIDRCKINLSWSAVDDIDLAGYRLRESGQVIADLIKVLNYTYVATESKQYNFTITAVDNSGNVSTAVAITVPVVPYPSNVTGFAIATELTDRSILNLTWDAVTDTDLGQYEIRLGDTWATGSLIQRVKTNKYSYRVMASGYYKLWIAAVNAAGNYSVIPVSADIQSVCEPNQPTNLSYAQDSRNAKKVILSWTPASGLDIAGYEISRNDVVIGFSASPTYSDTVNASATYQYKIRTKSVGGFYSGYANLTAAITLEPLDVTGFAAEQMVSDHSIIRLTWSANNAGDLSHYEIREGTSWDAGTVVAGHAVGTYVDITISAERTYTWWIKAVSSNNIYGLYPASVSGIFNLNPTPVSNIQMKQNVNDKSILNIQWAGVADGDLIGYQVKIGSVWESAEDLPLTQELYATYNLTSTGNIKVMIKTINSAGYYSDEVSATLYCKVEPLDVTGLVAYQNGETVELYWDKATEADVMAYEIREGANFDQGSLIATGVTQASYTVPVDSERDYKFFVKSINSSGHYSVVAANITINVQNLPVKNVISTYDEVALNNGTHSNTEFGQSLINFSNIGGKWSDFPTTKFSDVGGSTVLKLLATNGVYPTSGVYSPAQIDVGSIITANISARFVSTVILRGAGSAVLQFRTSQDGSNWLAWQDFKPVQRTFKYLELRVLLGTTDTSKTPEVNQFVVSIDVPDTDIAKSAAIAVGGTTVYYGHTFYTIPYVTPVAIGEGLHAELISKTYGSCVIKVKNASNTDVGGTADVRIKGY